MKLAHAPKHHHKKWRVELDYFNLFANNEMKAIIPMHTMLSSIVRFDDSVYYFLSKDPFDFYQSF